MKRALGLATLVMLLTCFLAQGGYTADRLKVYTVNYPLAYFAERIAGDRAEVTFPAPPGVDPAFWMPDAGILAAYQGADLILLNGAGFAHWTQRVSLPRLRLVDTSRGFRDAYIAVTGTISHSHGPSGDHSHGGVAFTTWLDPKQAVQQAEAIARALERKRPEEKERIERNLQALKADLLALDERMAGIIRLHRLRPLLASHPVYQYLARRYDLDLKSVTWEPDEMPSESHWAELEKMLRTHPADWMLWEGQPALESVERLRRLGVESVVFDPCGNRPEMGDYLSVMAKNVVSLEQIFR